MSNTRTTPQARAARAARNARAAETVTFLGNTYKVAEKIGIWPQMMLARAAQDGVVLGDMRGLSAVHATLENIIDEADWPRFQADMISCRTDDLQALLNLVTQAAQIVAARQRNGSAPADAVRGEVVSSSP